MIEKILAASTPLGSAIEGEGLGPFGESVLDEVEGLRAITSIVSSIVGVMVLVAGIWFLFNFIVGGIQWISAGGDKNNLQQAQQKITNAFIGLVIVVAGFTILSLASTFLGFDFLITDPGTVIGNLFPGGTP